MELQARADHLAQMIEDRLGVRGQGLAAKLRRAGRRLPRYVRREARLVVEALALEAHPKLVRRIDAARLDHAFGVCERYLEAIDPAARQRALLLNWLAGVAFVLLAVAGLVIAVLRWRGFL